MWGELAYQLGGADAYELVRASDESATAPGEALHELLQYYAPAVILIDEWVAYARQLLGRDDLPGGAFDTQFTFAQSLTEAAKATPGILLAISIPASFDPSEDSPDELGSDEEVGGLNGIEALRRLRNVVGRVADQWRPASATESYQIVRQRLLLSPMLNNSRSSVKQHAPSVTFTASITLTSPRGARESLRGPHQTVLPDPP